MGVTSLKVKCWYGCSLHLNNFKTRSNLLSIANRCLESLTIPEGPNELDLAGENTHKLSSWWEQLPKRWVIVLLCFTSFLLCHMDHVNRSIAILPKSQEFNWKSAIVGLIQFFSYRGYLLTQIVGSIWVDKISGKPVLGFGVIGWSVAIVLTPIAARINLPCLLKMRVVMGMGVGVAMPAMNNIISKWIPVSERSRALALIYSGMYLGFVTGLVFLPFLFHKFGWPSVFGSFESLGGAWFALWLYKAYSFPYEDSGFSGHKKISISREPVILSRAPIWALKIAHFCHNWGTFILLTWVPTYDNQVLKFHPMESGLVAVLPWLTRALFANIGGWMADTLVTRGLAVTSVRKIMHSIEVLGPVFLLSLLSQMKPPVLTVLSLPCRQGLDAFSQSGLILGSLTTYYPSHADSLEQDVADACPPRVANLAVAPSGVLDTISIGLAMDVYGPNSNIGVYGCAWLCMDGYAGGIAEMVGMHYLICTMTNTLDVATTDIGIVVRTTVHLSLAFPSILVSCTSNSTVHLYGFPAMTLMSVISAARKMFEDGTDQKSEAT